MVRKYTYVGTTGNVVLSNDGVISEVKQCSFTIYDAGNSGAAKTIDWANGQKQKVTMTDNCTFSFTNMVAGATYTLYLIQDGTGGRTHTWTGGGLVVAWDHNFEPTWITSIAAVNVAYFDYDGTTVRGSGWVPS